MNISEWFSVKFIYIDMVVYFSISWHLNKNVKMLFWPHINDIGRMFGSHLGDHLVCNRIWNFKIVIK